MRKRPIEWVETEQGCWNCTSHFHQTDYPMLTRDGHGQTVYGYLYEECFGFVPKGLVMRHKCNNRLCINPEHLELGTMQDNTHDMKKHGTYMTGENAPSHKLTWEEVKEIRRVYKKKLGGKLARKYGVVPETIQMIARGQTWTRDGFGRPVEAVNVG